MRIFSSEVYFRRAAALTWRTYRLVSLVVLSSAASFLSGSHFRSVLHRIRWNDLFIRDNPEEHLGCVMSIFAPNASSTLCTPVNSQIHVKFAGILHGLGMAWGEYASPSNQMRVNSSRICLHTRRRRWSQETYPTPSRNGERIPVSAPKID